MTHLLRALSVATVGASILIPTQASAQSLGTFRWQLQPFCNVVTLSVTAHGSSIVALDGFDDNAAPASDRVCSVPHS